MIKKIFRLLINIMFLPVAMLMGFFTWLDSKKTYIQSVREMYEDYQSPAYTPIGPLVPDHRFKLAQRLTQTVSQDKPRKNAKKPH